MTPGHQPTAQSIVASQTPGMMTRARLSQTQTANEEVASSRPGCSAGRCIPSKLLANSNTEEAKVGEDEKEMSLDMMLASQNPAEDVE